MDAAAADRVLAFLDAGTALLETTQRMSDILDPERGPIVAMTYRTDGAWIWTDTVSYYLREYGLAPDPDLLAHIERNGFVAGAPAGTAAHRALAALFRPAQQTPVRA
jgi:hypothetical protein